MNIDWFTFTAQLINFAILVWLLKRFLYGPIIKAMDDREARIAQRLQEAEDSDAAAERTRREYEAKLKSLSDASEQLQGEAQRDVEAWRAQHLQHAKRDVEAAREEWQKSLARDRQALTTEIQLDAARHATDISRHLLSELASTELQTSVVDRFLQELHATNVSEFKTSGANHVTVESAQPLSDSDQERIRQAVAGVVPNIEIDFRANADIICGIELHLPDARIAWSVRDSIAELESDLIDLIDRSIPSTNEAGLPSDLPAEIATP